MRDSTARIQAQRARHHEQTTAAHHVFAFACLAAALIGRPTGPVLAESTSDAALWMELGVRYEPHRKIRLGLDQHLRLTDNMSQPESFLTDLGVRFAPARWLRLAVGYRLATEADNDGVFQRRHRLNVDATFRHRFRPVILAFRLRFQEEARAEDDDGAPWRHTFRFRLSAEIRRTPVVDPIVAFELYLRVADQGRAAAARKLRGTAGVDFDTDAGTVLVAYRIEGRVEDRELLHILLLSWQIDIDR